MDWRPILTDWSGAPRPVHGKEYEFRRGDGQPFTARWPFDPHFNVWGVYWRDIPPPYATKADSDGGGV